MEEPPVCKGRLCRLCHGNFKSQFEKKAREAPFYAKPTAATIRRSIAVRLDSPKRPAEKPTRSASRLGFEDLPAEVRLQIYRACLRYAPGVLIAGWVKGGGFHADRGPPVYAKRLYIHATHSFPWAILVLNKRIHGEARHEIYKRITFHIAAVELQRQLPQIRYWLNEHPMKFTNRVEFPMTIMILKDFRATYSPLIQHPSTISIDHLFQLARIFLKMPNLKHLKFVLTLEMPSPLTASEVLRYAASKSAWKKRLATIRSGFPAGCRSALVIKAEGRYDRPALEVLKIEKEFVTLASSIEGFDEVRQFSAEEGPYSVVPRLGLFLQTIHVNTA